MSPLACYLPLAAGDMLDRGDGGTFGAGNGAAMSADPDGILDIRDFFTDWQEMHYRDGHDAGDGAMTLRQLHG